MSLIVACRCGRRFQAQAHLAGRQMPCPACGAQLSIPLAEPGAAADPLGGPMSGPGIAGPDPFAAGPLSGSTFGAAGFPVAGNATPFGQPAPFAYPGMPKPRPSNKGASTAGVVILLVGLAMVGLVVVGVGIAIAVRSMQVARNQDDRQGGLFAQNSAASPPAARSDSSDARTAGNWQKHLSAEGAFSIDIPHPIRTMTQNVQTPVGSTQLKMVVHEQKAGAYFVGYADYSVDLSATDTSAVLDGVCNGSVANLNGTVTERSPIVTSGQTGLEYRANGNSNGKPASLHSRIFLVKNRLYQVFWVGEPGKEPAAETQRFFNSFAMDVNKIGGPAASLGGLAGAGAPGTRGGRATGGAGRGGLGGDAAAGAGRGPRPRGDAFGGAGFPDAPPDFPGAGDLPGIPGFGGSGGNATAAPASPPQARPGSPPPSFVPTGKR